jgi:hypothetical protein
MGIVNTNYFLCVYKVKVKIKADEDSNEQIYTAEYSVYGKQNGLRQTSRSYMFCLYIIYSYYSVAASNRYTVI